jgi:hypothetical protein
VRNPAAMYAIDGAVAKQVVFRVWVKPLYALAS